MKIIGLNSHRGKSGKDTLAKQITETVSGRVVTLSFADELKRQCAYTVGNTPADMGDVLSTMHSQRDKDIPMTSLAISNIRNDSTYYTWLLEDAGFNLHLPRSPRWHCQQFGNGYMRGFLGLPNYWIDNVRAFMDKDSPSSETTYIITDVRQPNEYDWVKSMGGDVVRIERDWSIPEVDEVPLHETDTALDFHKIPVVLNIHGHPESMLKQLGELIDL